MTNLDIASAILVLCGAMYAPDGFRWLMRYVDRRFFARGGQR